MYILKYATAAFALFLLLPVAARSQEVPEPQQIKRIPLDDEDYLQICTLTSTGIDAHYHIKAEDSLRKKAASAVKSASISVDYFRSEGGPEWPSQAIAAFEYAVNIWETHISSPIPIRIEAKWVILSEFTLGSAGPTQVVQPPNGEPQTYYSIAQGSAIAGIDYVAQSRGTANETRYDITVNMNSNWDSWYFGTDAQTPEGLIDFVTVVLHELGHGLGFTGSVRVPQGQGTAEFGYTFPIIYDRFITDGAGNNLLNRDIYGSPSPILYDAVTGKRGGINFSGIESISANNGTGVPLYAPSDWSGGSSYSHVDLATYTNTENALMRPQIDRATAIHEVGPVVCGIFADTGWPLGTDCQDRLGAKSEITLNEEQLDFGVTNVNKKVQKTFTISNEADAIAPLVARIGISGGTLYLVGVRDQILTLEPGESSDIIVTYIPTFEGRSTGELEVNHNAANFESPLKINLSGEALAADKQFKLDQSYPNPFNPTTNIPYALTQTSSVRLDIFDSLGRHVQTLLDGEQPTGRYTVPFRADGYASGVYIYRLIVNGNSKSGKVLLIK